MKYKKVNKKKNTIINSDKVRLFDRRLVYFVMSVLFMVTITTVVSGAKVATLGTEMSELNLEKDILTKEISARESRMARESSLAEVEKKAKEDLGMVSIGRDITYVNANDVLSGFSFVGRN